MTHELKHIFQAYEKAKSTSLRCVLATVVALEGSSYRKPGVRMLILENGLMEGAVSGGCVEKEIARQAESVFKTTEAKMMTYDGRYRLGCEGILYILLELFSPPEETLEHVRETLDRRESLSITSYFAREDNKGSQFGSEITIGEQTYSLNCNESPDRQLDCFSQLLKPSLQLFVIGTEHDAVQLTAVAAHMGMDVIIVANPAEAKELNDFPGAMRYLAITPEIFPIERVDRRTAIILMNHSFSKDLQFLVAMHKGPQFYTGILGPYRRREDLLNTLLEYCPDVADSFLDTIHGPAGIDIGAITPQEIAVSILAEVLLVARDRIPVKLKDKKGSIHSPSA
jgi:xanthine/CO dehydrogenase XdhC/CoxF family maturation factor